MDNQYDLFIFAGEPSGDLHGEHLLENLKKKRPNLKIKGIGGPRMRAVGLECLLPMEEFQVMGFIDVLSSLPKLYRMFKKIRDEILSAKPSAVLFIDYPGFNLRMARSLKKRKSPSKLLQFVCPSVWAWGKGRIPLMEKNLDKLMTLLPFEPELFSHGSLDVEYVGHPLISRIESHQYDSQWRSEYGIDENQAIGGYGLVRKIAHGRFGAVFLAIDLKTGEEVALKIIPLSVGRTFDKLLMVQGKGEMNGVMGLMSVQKLKHPTHCGKEGQSLH